MKKLIITLYLFISFPLMAESSGSVDKAEITFGASLLDFTYKEFDDNNVLLDREDGLIPGFILGYRQNKNNLFTELSFSYHATDIQYDGQTQSGIPVKTRSDADILDLSFKVGSQYQTENKYQYELYAGLGYHLWQRNIRSTATVLGIFEEYDWFYFLLGAKLPLLKTVDSRLDFDIQYARMMKANIFVQLSSLGADDVNLRLGKKNIYRFSFPWRMIMKNSSVWVIEPYYEFWEIGKSETKPVTIGGIPTPFVVWEPRSETNNVGVNLKLVVPF